MEHQTFEIEIDIDVALQDDPPGKDVIVELGSPSVGADNLLDEETVARVLFHRRFRF
jgi:hypothetical protein